MTATLEVLNKDRPTDTGGHAFQWDYENLFLKNKIDLNEGINDGDCLNLTTLVTSLKTTIPLRILEVGSWKGGSASILALSSHPNGTIYCVDTWEGSVDEWNEPVAKKYDVAYIFLRNMALLGLLDRVHMIKCTSHKAATLFADKSLDMVFIDADHRYESVKQDINDWYEKVKDGGILAGHDLDQDLWEDPNMKDLHYEKHGYTNHAGVSKAVYEKFGKDYHFDRSKSSSIWWVVK